MITALFVFNEKLEIGVCKKYFKNWDEAHEWKRIMSNKITVIDAYVK
jgi:hypothetical protein